MRISDCSSDVCPSDLLGMLDVVSDRQPYGVPVWVSGPQVPVWEHSQLVIDVEPGRGTGCSLEDSEGLRFVSLARVVPAHAAPLRPARPEDRRVGQEGESPGRSRGWPAN